MRYVGLDAHLRQSTFCVLNDRRRKIVTRTVKHRDSRISTWASVFYLSFSWRAQPSRAWQGDVPAAVEFGRVAAAPVNTLRQQTHRCQEISVCF